ncbi:MAG: BrnT family toxin [Proteobacteria bacterium]|nr:BrnT family toxin [Pseudomonadota bacterium]
MQFEWDKVKNALNIQNHGISFEQAKEVFEDPLHISKLDYRFNYFEERWITLGATSQYKLIVVVHMLFDENNKEVIRIISARKANAKEANIYEK